jgi:phosphatidylinositol alpha-1,6-mannosyltransferase
MPFLFISNEFQPGTGEIRRYLSNLALALNSKKETIVLTTKSDGWKNFDSTTDINIIRAGKESSKVSKVTSINRMAAKIALKRKPSHIIGANWQLAGVTAANLNEYIKTPYSVILFGDELKTNLTNKRLANRLRSILDDASFIFVNSAYTASLLKPLNYENNKIHIAFPGGDTFDEKTLTDKEKIEFRKKLGVGGDETMIFSVSDLEQENAVDILIWSLQLLKQKSESFKLFIIGSGSDEKKLKIIINDLGIKDRISILTDEKRLELFYQTADIYIQLNRGKKNSIIDGLGLSILEAGYYNKPSIASENNITSEIITHNKTGILVPPLLPKETAEAIYKLMTTKGLAPKLGKAAGKNIRSKFQWNLTADVIENAIGEDSDK